MKNEAYMKLQLNVGWNVYYGIVVVAWEHRRISGFRFFIVVEAPLSFSNLAMNFSMNGLSQQR